MQLIPYVVESIVIIDIILLVLQTQFIDHKVHLSIIFKDELFLVIAFMHDIVELWASMCMSSVKFQSHKPLHIGNFIWIVY